MSDLKQPGQRAYETWAGKSRYAIEQWSEVVDWKRAAWAAVEAMFVPAEPEPCVMESTECDRRWWLRKIATSGRKTVSAALLLEALDSTKESLICTCKYHSVGCPVWVSGAFLPASGFAEHEQAGKAEPIAARPVVRWFAEQMEMALRRNDHKGGWHEDDQTSLATRVIEEANELLDAVDTAVIADDESLSSAQHYSRAAIAEATDVANMAMMVADHFREGGPSRDQGHDVAAEAGKAQGWVESGSDFPEERQFAWVEAPSHGLTVMQWKAHHWWGLDHRGQPVAFRMSHITRFKPLPAPPTKDPTNG